MYLQLFLVTFLFAGEPAGNERRAKHDEQVGRHVTQANADVVEAHLTLHLRFGDKVREAEQKVCEHENCSVVERLNVVRKVRL